MNVKLSHEEILMVLELKQSYFLARSQLNEISQLWRLRCRGCLPVANNIANSIANSIANNNIANNMVKALVRLQSWLQNLLAIRRSSIARAGSRSVPTPP
jgi:hypothetical protein